LNRISAFHLRERAITKDKSNKGSMHFATKGILKFWEVEKMNARDQDIQKIDRYN